MSNSKSTVIVAQVFISCMMAFLMTGLFTAVPMGFEPGWVGEWLRLHDSSSTLRRLCSLGAHFPALQEREA